MFLPHWRRRLSSPYSNRAARRRRQKLQPKLQSLEPRSLLSVTPAGATFTPFENTAFNGTVATFTSTDALPSFSASIDWGDGTADAGTVSGGSGTFTVSGAHTYAEDGAEPVAVEIIDSADSTTATAQSTANIQENGFGLTAGGTVSATEGVPLVGLQLATFRDLGSPDAASDFDATIAWGDGATDAGTISGSGGNFTVTGNHTYTDELAAATYTIMVSEPEAGFSFGPVGNQVTVADADVLAGTAAPISVTEGATFAGTAVAVFTDTGHPTNAAGDFAAAIDWGDGTTDVGTVSGDSGIITVSGNHAYADEGSFPVTVTLADNAPGTASATATAAASVAEGDSGTRTPTTIIPSEGQAFSGSVGTFTDEGNPLQVAGDFTATIDWGDGTTTAGTVSGPTGGPFTISGSHTYLEDGVYTIDAVFSDDAPSTLTNITISSTAEVSEADLTVTPIAGFTVTEGATKSGAVATIADPGSPDPASDYSATIDWGDGTATAGTVTGAAGAYTVSGTHAYTDEGSFIVTVTATEMSAVPPATATATLVATVDEADVLTGTAGPISVTEGTTFTGTALAVFTNTGYPSNVAGDFTAAIDWGDGTTDVATVTSGSGTLTVSGNHAYADEGSFPLTVTLIDNAPGTATATATATASVAEADVLVATAAPIATTEGTVFASSTLATFSDGGYPGNVPGDFTATVDWGDGTTDAGTVSGGAGTFTVSGSHIYADEGSFPVTVTLADNAPGTTAATTTTTANVAEGDVLAGTAGPITATEGAVFTGSTLATFSDTGYPGNAAADFTATVDWGDGTTDTGTISGGAGTFTVSGNHAYADEGSFPVTVTLVDNAPGAALATAAVMATVAENDTLVAGASVTASSTEGATFSGTVGIFTDTTYAGNLSVDFSASINWGDGTVSAGTVGGSAGSFTVSGSHVYAEEGTETATIVLSDKAPGTATGTATAMINVADATLTATGATVRATEAVSFTGVVASFTDASPGATVSDFSATIAWGDGATTAGTVAADGSGGFQVTGTHTYVEDGSFTITVSIADVGGSSATATSTAAISEPSISIAPVAVSGFERAALTNVAVATFTHGNGGEAAGKFTATIQWGDGTSSAGVVSKSGTTYTTSGTHTYLDEGAFAVAVQLSDDTASADVTTSAVIKEELLPNGIQGTANERFIQEVYRDLLHRAVDAGALPFWSSLLDQGESRLKVVRQIIAGALPAELGADLVTGMYEKYLGREPEAAGLAFWVGIVSKKETIEDTEANIAGTDEFFALAGGTDSGFITRLFNLALGRNPEPQALAAFNAALAGGASREQVAAAVFNSHEFHQDEVAGYYQAAADANGGSSRSVPFIDDLDFLDRPADAGGLTTFTAALDNGALDEDVWAVFMASDEDFAKTA